MFNYTDHLEGGALKKCPVNIFSERARWREERVSYGKDPATNVLKILEENHYYPFGMKHQNYNVDHLDFNHYPGTGVALVPLPAVANVSYNYKYNGKELQEELGLNMYDYGARNYDPALGRWMNVDPLAEKNNFESPYVFVHNNPLIYVDPDGRDGIIVIKDGQININANIYAYGAGATKAVVAQMQKDINSRWGGNFSAQTSDGKQKFNVNVNVSIGLYEGKEKNDPFIIEESWNSDNRDNFIEIGAGDKRSYVSGGDEGEWRSQGRNGLTLAQDDPAPHEVGHLLGLDDRYTDKKGPNKGWETNIMGNSQNGKVEQRNIDGILGDAMKAYEVWSKDKNNAGKEFRYEINTSNPNKENK